MTKKLTLEKKKLIVELYKQGIEQKHIAERFGLAKSTVSKVLAWVKKGEQNV